MSRSFGKMPVNLLFLFALWFLTDNHRDPWWVFTTISLFYTIKREYNFGLWELVQVSPRFGVMLVSMCLSIAFIIVDTCSVTHVFSDALPTGIEPFWKVRAPQSARPFSLLQFTTIASIRITLKLLNRIVIIHLQMPL